MKIKNAILGLAAIVIACCGGSKKTAITNSPERYITGKIESATYEYRDSIAGFLESCTIRINIDNNKSLDVVVKSKEKQDALFYCRNLASQFFEPREQDKIYPIGNSGAITANELSEHCMDYDNECRLSVPTKNTKDVSMHEIALRRNKHGYSEVSINDRRMLPSFPVDINMPEMVSQLGECCDDFTYCSKFYDEYQIRLLNAATSLRRLDTYINNKDRFIVSTLLKSYNLAVTRYEEAWDQLECEMVKIKREQEAGLNCVHETPRANLEDDWTRECGI